MADKVLEQATISEAQTSGSASLEAFDSMKAGSVPSVRADKNTIGLPDVQISDMKPAASTQEQIADELLKNPAIFHGVLRSSFQKWNKGYWGDVEHAEVTRVANDPKTDSIERKAAQIVDENFDLFAGLYSSKRKLDTGDMDEFAAALKLDSCGSSLMADATARAARYGIGVYGVSKMLGSDQAGLNTVVGVTSSLFANLILEGIRRNDREEIRALNYFNIPEC